MKYWIKYAGSIVIKKIAKAPAKVPPYPKVKSAVAREVAITFIQTG